MEQHQKSINRKDKKWNWKKNPWDTILGDCKIVDNYLKDRPVSQIWFLLHFINVFLRAIGQLAFLNNPFGGFLILGVIFSRNWMIGIGTALGCGVATLGELVLRLQEWDLSRSGQGLFNAVLIGTVLQACSIGILQAGSDPDEVHVQPVVLVFIICGSFLSIFLCSSLGNLLSKSGLPYLALPYNIVILCSMTLLINSKFNLSLQQKIHTNETSKDAEEADVDINWELVFKGVVNSFGQLWCLDDDVVGSGFLVIIIGVMSPLTLACEGVGALFATLGAVAIAAIIPGPRGNEMILEAYRGLWGFQGILSMTGISCIFFACNGASFGLGLINCLVTVFVQFGLGDAFRQRGIPVFTLPFTLCSMLLINVTDGDKRLTRVQDLMGYPEKHAYNNHFCKHEAKQKSQRITRIELENRELDEVNLSLIGNQNV